MKRIAPIPILMISAFQALLAQSPNDDIAKLMKSIDGSMFPTIASASLKLTSYKSGVVQKEIAMDMMIKNENNLIAFSAPATDKGKFILKAEKNLWMYFSDVKRSIRLSTREAFMGTDATNYDLLQLNIISDYDINSHSEATLDDKPVIKVELVAKKGTEGYAKITSWVDPKERRLIKNDCFSLSGVLIKTIQYQAVGQFGSYKVPTLVTITNHLDKSRTTVMKFTGVRPKKDIPSTTFTLGYLESQS